MSRVPQVGNKTSAEQAEYFSRLGTALESRRQEAGLTYAEIARRSGVAPSTVRRNFAGQIGFYWITDLLGYAEAMGVKVSDMVREAEAADLAGAK